MNEILEMLVYGREITDKDIETGLYDLCDDLHACECYNCPVYIANGNSAPGSDKPFNVNRGCDCFKNGHEMLTFLRSHA